MPLFLLFSLISLTAFSQESTPVIDPNKLTVCAITINSDDEKKLFDKEISKFPKKFNPIVELTNFGEDWFEKSCKSGIRCDQLVISGHFGGEFFGDSDKRLSLSELETKGCSKTCDGILNKPYEVFLMGCNTLAGREEDHRTPEQYFQVLIEDGISAAQAEQVVQSRYGTIGDSNNASMQRAFMGLDKRLYGFYSVGPSGKNVKPLLENYFRKISVVDHLEGLANKRAIGQVLEANEKLAKSLKISAYTECSNESGDDEKVKNICLLNNEKLGLDTKISLIEELLTKDDFLVYIPYIKKVVQDLDLEELTESQKSTFARLAGNETLKRQFLGLADKSLGLAYKNEILDVSKVFGFISEAEVQKILSAELIKTLSKPLTLVAKDNLCSISYQIGDEIKEAVKAHALKRTSINLFDLEAFGCLDYYDNEFVKKALAFSSKAKDLESQIEVLNYLYTASNFNTETIELPLHLKNRITKLLDDDDYDDWGLELFTHFLRPTPKSISIAKNYLKESDDMEESALAHLAKSGDVSSFVVEKALSSIRPGDYCIDCAAILTKAGRPEGPEHFKFIFARGGFDQRWRHAIQAFESHNKLDRKIQEVILALVTANKEEQDLNDHLKLLDKLKLDSDIKEKIQKLKKH